MKLSEAKYAFTFDDLMLIPQHSDVKSRKAPDVRTKLSDTRSLDIPIVSAPMNTVTEHHMMKVMSDLGGSSVLHRYMSSDDQLRECIEALKGKNSRRFFVAVGASGDFVERAYRLYDTLGIADFCVDVANGHSEICIRAIEALMSKMDKLNIMAGNVCTYEGTMRLAEAGAGIIRVGVGPGSMCKTRIVTGHGVPQLSAIEDCARVKDDYDDVTIIADGGIRNSGDIVKALAAGADAVMLGGLLAGADETPGEIYELEFRGALHQKMGKFKRYAGMASEEGRKFNGWFTEEDASFIPEGESVEVPYKGPVKSVIDNLVGGLRVGMSYAGAMSIKDLQENAEWVRVTENGRVEGTPHGKK